MAVALAELDKQENPGMFGLQSIGGILGMFAGVGLKTAIPVAVIGTGLASEVATVALLAGGAFLGYQAGNVLVRMARNAVVSLQNHICKSGLNAGALMDNLPLAAAAAKSVSHRDGTHSYFVKELGQLEFREVGADEFSALKARFKKSDIPLVSIDLGDDTYDVVTSVRGRVSSVPGKDGKPFPAVLALAINAGKLAVKKAGWFDDGAPVSPPSEVRHAVLARPKA